MAANGKSRADTGMQIFGISLSLWVATAAACFAQQYPVLAVLHAPHGIYTLFQDRESELWLGTIDDVDAFDGEHFYSLRRYGFPRETPNTFAEDDRSGIWIGTQGTDSGGGTGRGGLYRYQAGRVAKVFTGDVLSVIRVSAGLMLGSFATEVSGRAAYGDLYLFRERNGKWIPYKLLSKAADHLSIDHHGNVLFPCPGGWCEMQTRQLEAWRQKWPALAVLRHPGSPLVERVLRDRFGCVWSRAEAFATYQCPDDTQPVRIEPAISEDDGSAHLEESSGGSIFMLVPMVLGRPGHFSVARNLGGGIPMDSATIAKDGTIWVGAETGLYRFMYPFHLELWDSHDGVGSAAALARVGSRVFATDSQSGSVESLDAHRTTWKRLPNTTGDPAALIALQDHSLLLANRSRILHVGEKGGAIGRISLSGQSVDTSLAVGSGNTVWLGANGISTVDWKGGRALHPLSIPPPAGEINSLRRNVPDLDYDGSHKTLWACYGKSVLSMKQGHWTEITQQEGLPDQYCSSVASTPDGNTWVGERSSPNFSEIESAAGRLRIRNFANDADTPTANSSTHFVRVDSLGRIWRAGNALYVATEPAAESGHWLRLDAQDGVSVDGISGEPFLADQDGSVWFGTNTGVAHFLPPADFAAHFPAPGVFIGGLSINHQQPELADSTGTVKDGKDVTAYIGTLQFDRRHSLHFRYRLLPGSYAWKTVHGSVLDLGIPGWGQHTLQVQAALATGPWSTTASQSFTVLRPTWLTWPFLGGYFLAGGTLLTGTRRWRKARRRRAEKLLPGLAEWRLAALSPELQQLSGATLDSRFVIGIVLARGGFATVTAGRDLQQNGRPCAVKIFRQELVEKEWLEHHFRQEVQVLARLRHPNIVSVYGYGKTPQGSPYLVMEFIDGSTLRELLNTRPLSRREIARYIRQAGSALEEIHSHGIFHRDLKPENLMIRRLGPDVGEIVLIDFSIAIVQDPDETMYGLSRAAGTLQYMAPEQAVGYADSSTDIYSLARIVIEMLTGQRLSQLLPDASLDLPQRVRELLSQLPQPLRATGILLLSTALEFDPMRRPRSAGFFALGVAEALDFQVAVTDDPSASFAPSPTDAAPDAM